MSVNILNIWLFSADNGTKLAQCWLFTCIKPDLKFYNPNLEVEF